MRKPVLSMITSEERKGKSDLGEPAETGHGKSLSVQPVEGSVEFESSRIATGAVSLVQRAQGRRLLPDSKRVL